MKRAGLNIPDGYEVTGDFEFNGGFDAMRQLLSHPLRPQAVFTGNDAMAVGVYRRYIRQSYRFRRISR